MKEKKNIIFKYEKSFINMVIANVYYKLIKLLFFLIISTIAIIFFSLTTLLLYIYHNINVYIFSIIMSLILFLYIMIIITSLIFPFIITCGQIPLRKCEYTKISIINDNLYIGLLWPVVFHDSSYHDDDYIYNIIPLKYIANVRSFNEINKKEHTFLKKILYKKYHKNNCINYLYGTNNEEILYIELNKSLPMYNYRLYQLITGLGEHELNKEKVKSIYISLKRNDIPRLLNNIQ